MELDSNIPIIVAITGASGAIYGVTILKELKKLNIATETIVSNSGFITLKHELNLTIKDLSKITNIIHNNSSISASIASGSYKTKGMIIAPCSVKTLSSIANCYSNNLITRAADVTLKESRKLVLLFRETPLHLGHIEIMKQASLNGAIIMPPVPAFYNKPQSIEDIVNQTVARVLDGFNIKHNLSKPWNPSNL